MAIEELNLEMVKAKARAEINPNVQPATCPLKKANKRFLGNTLRSVLNFNKRKGATTRIKSMKKLHEVEERVENPESASKPTKFGDRQHIFKKKKRKKSRSSPEPKKSPPPAKLNYSDDDVDSGSSVIVLD